MAVTPGLVGRRLAHYDITAHIGSGGMGDVYRATDARLGRDVALKLLPSAVAGDSERTARFQREARALAAFNHPHIAQIYGFEESVGVHALVMELVEGPTLADVIASRPRMGVAEVLGFARQIAEALEAAHEKGIVHRDLKPANVKLTLDGQVKVLDFGLARLSADGSAAGSLAESPTLTGMATRAGVILGTVPYMAPEQAMGRPVDRRADIFAFGCVLFEMLTGGRAFEGDNAQEVLSRVLQREPDWSRIPNDVPAAVHRLLRLCLEKDPRKRRQSAGDVRIDLEQALLEAPPAAMAVTSTERGPRVWIAWLVAAAAVAVAVGAVATTRVGDAPPAELRLQVSAPRTRESLGFALSPDGRSIVVIGPHASGEGSVLYVRSLETGETRVIAGTDGVRDSFWSADGRSIGFFAQAKLLRVDVAGGSVEDVTAAPNPLGGAWNADGTILFAPHSVSPILKVSAAGGEPVAATELESPRHQGHYFPSFLPGGRQFLYYVYGEPDAAGIYLGSLDGAAAKRLTPADTAAVFHPPDRIMYVQQGALVTRRLDISRGELAGDPVTLATAVGVGVNRGAFSVSATGAVAYRSATAGLQARMTWFNRTGRVLGHLDDAAMNGIELSPDDRRVAFDRQEQGNRDVWITELARGSLTRFTFDPAIDGYPVWSPDGSRIVFESSRRGQFHLWTKASNGTGPEELILETPDTTYPLAWSGDGRWVLYQRTNLRERWDLWALPLTGSDRTPIVVANTPFAERMGTISPDGRWVAYETDESGRPEIVAQAFPRAAGRFPISTDGGVAPRWSADGREVYFLAADGRVMAGPVRISGTTFEAGTPVTLFPTHVVNHPFKHPYAVSRDGRFLVLEALFDDAAAPIELILNWKP